MTDLKMCKSGRVFISKPSAIFSRKAPKAALPVFGEFEAKLEVLKDTVDGLVKVSNGLEDGRIVSLEKEYKVSNVLLDKFPNWVYGKSKNRDVGDIYVSTASGVFPVNIKLIGNNGSYYNNICGLVRTVGQLLYGRTISNRAQLATAMAKEPFTTEPQEYGVIAVNKGTGEAKCFTLFNILELYVNPSNAFQFNMKTLNTISRTQAEGQQFIFDRTVEFFESQAVAFNILNGNV